MRVNITLPNHKSFKTNVDLIHEWWIDKNPTRLAAEIEETIAWYGNRDDGSVQFVDVPYNPPEYLDEYKFLNGEDALIQLFNDSRPTLLQRIFKAYSNRPSR